MIQKINIVTFIMFVIVFLLCARLCLVISLCICTSSPCTLSPNCKQDTIYVFPEIKLRSPNFHIHVSVSDLHIPTIGPPVLLQQKRLTDT
jgi:hypothetical protein